MVYILILFHLLIFVECFLLYRKKLRKSCILLFLINMLTLILNLIECWSLFSIQEISSVIYLQRHLHENFFLTFIWILINAVLLIVAFQTVKKATKRQVQNLALKIGIYSILLLEVLLFTCVVFSTNSDFFIFIYIVLSFYFLIKTYMKHQKNYILAITLILLLFTWYSYCTYEGAARLQIALNGYPKQAYEMGIEEQKYYREENMRKYVPIENVEIREGEMGIIEVKNYIFLKFGSYSEY